jgi:hypothetical protein
VADSGSVAKALHLGLAASADERRQRGAAGRELLHRSYTWDKICRRLLEACETYCR